MFNIKFSSALLALVFTTQVFAAPTSFSDDFTQATDANNWVPLNDACLTAGTATTNSTTVPTSNSIYSSIPSCDVVTPSSGGTMISPADAPGSGALRLTPAKGSEHGAIVSNYSMSSTAGLQVTFTTYAYAGSKDGLASEGADGLSFFLQDATYGTSVGGSPNLGSWGGSLAYSCSNTNPNYTGLTGGYLGLGMDEYGNFLNGGSGNDNTATGIPIQTVDTGHGANSFYSGSYQQANRIGLRGAGVVSAYWLNKWYSSLYTSGNASTAKTAVLNTCKTGLLQNGGSGTKKYSISALSWAGGVLTITTSSAIPVLQVGSTDSITIVSNGNAAVNQTYHVTTPPASASTTLKVPLATNPGALAAGGSVEINVMDYPAIANGYYVLPSTQKLANDTTGASRSGTLTKRAWPVTYKLIITPGGLLTYMYSYDGGAYQTVLTNFPITQGNGPLPNNFSFGFAASTGGSYNVHEITCFAAQPLQSSSSASANTVQAGNLQTNTQIYLASYNNNTWSGSVTATGISQGAGGLVIAANATWDANCVLTGGACSSTGTAIPLAEATSGAGGRQLLTWNGSTGVALASGSLTSAQQAVLNKNMSDVTDTNGGIRLDWLRGGRSNELTTGGPLRVRSGVLGDIVDSSPTWIGQPSTYNYATFTDTLYGTAGTESSYASFSTSHANRLNMVYAGSNDGLLHGFRAGYAASTSNNDGKEVIGFMPSSAWTNPPTNPNLAPDIDVLTDPTYGHNYFVDATPGNGDLYYSGAWHTWLVGGLGAGGKEIYALDVTDPSTFSETNAASLVVGDWTSSTITCANAAGCNANMGLSYGTPIIRRLHNGQWAIIFGNGLNSSSGLAGVYVGLVSSSGTVSFRWLGTNAATSNGISYVTSADFDGDHITDYLYAGDLLGNVWRFNLTSSNPSDWAVSKYGQPTAAPLFTAKIGAVAQPITTSILVTVTNTGGAQRVILGFGTGSSTPFTTATSGTDTYASGAQTVYGIWDWDFNDWNSGTTTASSVHINGSAVPLSSLPLVLASPYRTFTRSALLVNSVAAQVNPVYTNGVETTMGTRTVAQTSVCWQGSSSCPNTINTSSTNNQYGWMFDLPDTVNNSSACGPPGSSNTCHEQTVYNPTFIGGEMILNTTTPPKSVPGQCTLPTPGGWTMGFNMASGGGTPQDLFTGAGSGSGPSVVGESFGGVGTSFVITTGGATPSVNLITSTGSAIPPAVPSNITLPSNTSVKRVSWEVLR